MRVILFLLLLMTAVAAQTGSPKTPAQLNAEINSQCPDNNVGLCTPAIYRQNLLDIVASAVGASPIVVTNSPYNAVCNGIVDDTSTLQAALNAAGALPGGGTVFIPSVVCFTSSGITVPSNVRLVGNGFFAANPQAGSQIRCALSTPVCVQVGTNSSNGSVQVFNIGVTRAAGTPSSATIGVLVKDSYNVKLSNVGSFNHGICFEAQSDTVFGISLHADNLSTGACVDAHFVDNSWPEVFLLNSRFGMDGAGDYNSNAYIRFTGGTVGPNTFYSLGNQFNQGSGLVVTAIDFKSLTTPTNGITSEFSFIGNHFETMNYVVQTDTSATEIQRLKLIGNTVLNTQGSGQEFWHFGVATAIYDLNITNNTLFQNSFTFNPGGQISSAIISQNQFLFSGMTATFNGTGGGNALSATGNIFNGSVTLSGSWALGEFGGSILSGNLVNTATGAVSANFLGHANPIVCNGSTDYTTIQNAINLASTIGGTVSFVPGTACGLGNNTLTFPGNYITLDGGVQGTTLSFSNSANNDILIGNGSGLPGYYQTRLRNLTIRDTARTSGQAVQVLGASQPSLYNVQINSSGATVALWAQQFNDMMVDQSFIYGGLVTFSPANNAQRSDQFTISNTLIQPNTPRSCWNWDGMVQTVNAYNVVMINCTTGIVVSNNSANNSFYPAFGTFVNMQVDGSTLQSVWIQGGYNMQFIGSDFNGSGIALNIPVVQIDPDAAHSVTRQVKFIGGGVHDVYGRCLVTNSVDFSMIGTDVYDCGKNAANTYAAVEIAQAAGTSNVLIADSKIGFALNQSSTSNYGVVVDSAVTGSVLLTANNFNGNATGSVNDATAAKIAVVIGGVDFNGVPLALKSTPPTSAGAGGLFVCVDNTGVFYKKATCP